MHNRLVHYTVIRISLIIFILAILTTNKIFAKDYTLPYPGFMPGHPLYKVSEIIDRIQELWSFGNLSKFKYYLGAADKKLIEAKTLFEYKQHLLATRALLRYEDNFKKASYHLGLAQDEGKDISHKSLLFIDAKRKHREVLENLKSELPKEFIWSPEIDRPKTLELHKLIEEAINIGKEEK